jgi:hypothetical protein
MKTLYFLNEDNNEKYAESFEMYLRFIYQNELIELDKNSDAYGVIIAKDELGRKTYDVSSTAWLVYILSDCIERGFTQLKNN